MIGLQLRLIRLDYTCKRVGSRSSTLAIFRLLPFHPMVTFNHHTGKLISGWPRHAVSRHQKTSGEPRDDFGFFPCRWKHRKTTTVSDYHGPFTQPSPLISFSSFLPISIYLSISLSTVCFLSLLCPSVGQPATRPLVLRSGRAIFICSVSSVVFLYGLWSFANMPCYCAPATIILYTLILSYFSLCFPIPSDHLNTIFFCLSFLFQSFTSCLVASWWCREFSVPSVFLWFVRFLLCIYFRHDLQSQVVVVPTVLFHFILFLVLFCLLLLSVLSISCRFFFFQFFL